MKTTKALFLVVAFLASTLSTSTSYAASWLYVNERQDYTCYVDISSIEKNGDIISAWFKMTLKKKAKPDIIKGKALYEAKFKYEAKISTHEGRATNAVYYTYRGDVIYSDSSYSPFVEDIPESLGEGWSNFMRNWFTPKSSAGNGMPEELVPPIGIE